MTPEPRSAAPSRKRLLPVIAMIATFIMTFSLAAPASATPQTAPTTTRTVVVPPVRTADLSNFRPGNIISDEVFFASNSMSQAQIDSFLKSKVSSCRSGYTCLKDYRQSTPNRAADSYCKGYSGAANESAAAIIYKSAVSCGINPQVLIVMLEKEQSLVTHTWPSSWRYDMALGQGCPDTAPCDPSFSGFFYQIYGAARQMKIYTEGKWFTWYAPGKTWNIRYNPNESCGSSPVYVENAATAALYYYTPYQPNPAALRAGYGIGDNCSAYGNRNFYNLFNDWFGSTQSPQVPANSKPMLAKTAKNADIYLIVEGQRLYVNNQLDLRSLLATVGSVKTITASAMNSYPAGIDASRLVRDARDGAMYLIEPDKTKHWFPSASLVSAYGFSMAEFTSLPADLIDAYKDGADVNAYFRGDASPNYYKWENNTRRHVVNDIAWNYVASETNGYVALLSQATVNNLPVGAAILGPRSLVKEANSPEVYIAGFGPDLLHINSWTSANELGVTDLRVVPDGTLSKNPRGKDSLSAFIACGTQRYVIGGGAMTPVKGDIGNAPVATVADSICRALPQTGKTISTPFLVKANGSPDIYSLSPQGFKYIQTEADLRVFLNGKAANFYTALSSSTISALPAAGWIRDGTLIGFGGDEIFVMQGGLLRHIMSRETLMNLAAPNYPHVTQLPSTLRSAYPKGQDLP